MNVLVTGGTGSFGSAFAEHALTFADGVTVFSRDELKQSEMATRLPDVHYVLGDIRDRDRLAYAMRGCDMVIHAAAMKRVPECEDNPAEAVATNVNGSRNVVRVASGLGCRAVIMSTDKAVIPNNVYGSTKMLAERLFLESGFTVVRCGNIWGSRGSVVPLFREQARTGIIAVTDPRMTRYSITLAEAVRAVREAMRQGGGIYVPKMKTYRILDVVEAISPGCEPLMTGLRPGERLHECLITEDEAVNAYKVDGHYVINPEGCGIRNIYSNDGVEYHLEPGALYSNKSADWLTVEEMRGLL